MGEPRIAHGFRFGPYLLDSETGDLYRQETLIHTLTGQQLKFLLKLLKNAGRVVKREELIDAIWGKGKEPREPNSALNALVSNLNKTLAPDGSSYIKTVWGVGYQFAQSVEIVLNEIASPVVIGSAGALAGDVENPTAGSPARSASESRRTRILLTILACAVVVLIGIYLVRRTPKPQATVEEVVITSPAPGGLVDQSHPVSVRAPGAEKLCVVIKDPEGGYHNQPDVIREGGSSWGVQARFGIDGSQDIGKPFVIRAISGCNSDDRVLSGWPPGPHSEITVTRQ
jgi:DNA-binding winged helix-turn-helix (wHTH) protein